MNMVCAKPQSFIRLLHHSLRKAERSPQVTMQMLASSQCSLYKGACLQRSCAQPARQAAAKQCIVAKASKASDFRRFTDDEIDEQVQAAKKSLMVDFRVPQVRSQKKPKCQLKWDLEVKIAQLLTVKRERELENKISKRTSRSQQRNKNVLAGFGNI